MQPEGIVDVLRHLCEAVAPGGQVVDLQAVQPSGRVEIDGRMVGRIDDRAFFQRARRAVAGLDALVHEGPLRRGEQVEFDTLVRFDTGAELVAEIADSDEREMPDALADLLRHAGPYLTRERSMVRVLRRAENARRG
jgi:hypothetical protein